VTTYRFGSFVLDTVTYRLCRDAETLDLTARQLDLLAYLVARPGQLVTRDDLFRDLWPGVAVTDNALTQLMSDLRRTLEDGRTPPRYVETVARRGYRFVAPVEASDRATPSLPPASEGQFVQTSNLEVLRSILDGRLKLESLSTADIESAIASFAHAVELDPTFAGGYVGLGTARFWKYELTRSGFQPDAALLAAAVQDARQAVVLAPSYAEAHATLSYLLTASGRFDEARDAARRAVALQPEWWAHHFRLGHATWGADRLRALARSVELYPAFAFAHYEMAMVHVARRAFDVARGVLQEGGAIEARSGKNERRFPANGLHWMLGAIALRQSDVAVAVAECDREMASAGQSLYAREFSLAALNTRAFALLTDGALDRAAQTFMESLAVDGEQVRPHIGLAQVAQARGHTAESVGHRESSRRGVLRLERAGRSIEAVQMEAAVQLADDQPAMACETLNRLFSGSTPSAGWSIPIDPLFASVRRVTSYERVERMVEQRASVDIAGPQPT
jgi:DNA-binding winged helix-turn-helix (wHTH) protein